MIVGTEFVALRSHTKSRDTLVQYREVIVLNQTC